MPGMTFLGLAERVLAEQKRPLSPSEIWKVAVAKGYPKELRKQGKTPAQTLYTAIYIDARDNPRTLFVKVGDRPSGFAPKLYSFEIKKELSFANLREAFFQAVSNSSFANEGYLVAADISADEDFRSELRRLSASFGIGIIELDIEDPNSSHVLVPAKEREAMDWDALNKVAMNSDVRDLLRRICKDLVAKEIRSEEYDKVLQPEALIASIRQDRVTRRSKLRASGPS